MGYDLQFLQTREEMGVKLSKGWKCFLSNQKKFSQTPGLTDFGEKNYHSAKTAF